MTTHRILTPRPCALSASLRDLGYSVETAIADIIDNSITAQASRIDIICDASREPLALAILDNGTGMNQKTLMEAMRPGTYGPDAPRKETDLGRYGLGLKTASFSQCLQLTVVSAQKGRRHGMEWDLERVMREDKWAVGVLDEQEIAAVPHVGRLGKQGTLVLWRKIDRFEKEMVPEMLSRLTNHLELVFHRFLSGEKGRVNKIKIYLNNKALSPFDPFMREPKLRSQWKIQNETYSIDGNVIVINGYTLPHFSRLPAKLEKIYKDRSEFSANQGFYVYRNCRLMTWGDWFKIIPRQEKAKYSRVQIDFPSTLDHLWKIDIKKSTAVPPQCLRDRLKKLIDVIIEPSVKIIKGRGPQQLGELKLPVWERVEHRDHVVYAIKKDHAIIRSIENLLDENGKKMFFSLIDFLAAALPVESIYADGAEKKFETNPVPNDQLRGKLDELFMLLNNSGTSPDRETFRITVQALPSLFGSEEAQKIVEEYIREKMP